MFEEFEILEALTKKRLELIRSIMQEKPLSIRQLAFLVDRDVKNVWADLRVLERYGLIKFKIEGRVKRPCIKKQIIIMTVNCGDEE